MVLGLSGLLVAVFVRVGQVPVAAEPLRISPWQWVAEPTGARGYLGAGPLVLTAIRPIEEVWLEVSHYSCSEAEGTAACVEAYTGKRAGPGTAASRVLPAGTRLIVRGQQYVVRDYCGGCRDDGVDLWEASRARAFERGRQRVLVTIERRDD